MQLRLQDIEDLADEVRRAVSAGVPLESSLSFAAAGHGSRLKGYMQRLAQRLEQGESLAAILAEVPAGVGRLLAAAVGAGLRSGRPALTLELLSDYVSDVIDLRSRIAEAAAYPLAVLATASVLVCGGSQLFLERYQESVVTGLGVQPGTALMWLLRLNSDYPWWVFVFPAVLGFLLIYWMTSGRTARVSFRGPERLLLCLPGLGAMAGDLQSYNLTRMLWLLLQHELPLADALLLAGAACGTPRLERACSGLAREVSQGRATCDSESSSSVGLPPLLRVSLLQTAGQEDRLVLRLQATAGFYRQRFERSLLWLRLLMPAVLLVVIGGGCVLGYSLLVFWPVLELFQGLSVATIVGGL